MFLCLAAFESSSKYFKTFNLIHGFWYYFLILYVFIFGTLNKFILKWRRRNICWKLSYLGSGVPRNSFGRGEVGWQLRIFGFRWEGLIETNNKKLKLKNIFQHTSLLGFGYPSPLGTPVIYLP